MVTARFAAHDVFPSAGPELVTSKVFGGASTEENKIPVRIPLKASLTVDLGELITTSSLFTGLPSISISSNLGTSPKYGISRRFFTSSGYFIVLSKYSRKNANPIPAARPSIMPKSILLFLSGFEGSNGTSAISITLILPVFISSVREVSFKRLISRSYICFELSACL